MLKIVIIEDNTLYLKQMEHFFRNNIKVEHQIQSFPLGDWAEGNIPFEPNIFILDNFLQTKFSEASNGISLIEKFKKMYPNALFVLHSSFNLGEHEITKDFLFVQKNEKSLNQLIDIITKNFANQNLEIT